MITITDGASQELNAYFADKEQKFVRIYFAPGGCGGARLALAMDEPGEDDFSLEDRGIIYCINKELLKKVGAVSIEVTPMGFSVLQEIPFPEVGGGSSCGGSCGSCGGTWGDCH